MKNQNNIVTFFPKAVYCEDNVYSNLSELETSIKNLSKDTVRNSVLNVDSSHRTIKTIHNRPEFYPLCKQLKVRINKFLVLYGYHALMTRDVEISNMWFNISNQGDFLFPHTHPGSLLSGAFYVKSTTENKILFYEHYKNTYMEPDKITELSETTKDFDCIPGRLLLFHSELEHATPLQRDPGEKIVISFNTRVRTK